MDEFNCIEGLEQIKQLIRKIQLEAAAHEHLALAFEEIRLRLAKCDELESQDSE